MSLYHKYRPKGFDGLFGNKDIIPSLKAIFSADKSEWPHAFLLHGPTGCGKTTIARIIAKQVDAYGVDYNEVDSADFRGIDTIREIRRKSNFMATNGENKIWIIDECHRLTNDAQNATLKILEDPPSHVYFVLCTTEPQKLLMTIRGRCKAGEFQVSLLNDIQMKKLLKYVVRHERKALTKEVYNQIILDSMGHPRDALQILDTVLKTPKEQRLKIAKKTAEEQSQSIELCRALISQGSSWNNIRSILKGLKEQDPESIRRHVLGYCNSVLLNGKNDRAAMVMNEFIEPFYNIGFPGLTLACYSVFLN